MYAFKTPYHMGVVYGQVRRSLYASGRTTDREAEGGYGTVATALGCRGVRLTPHESDDGKPYRGGNMLYLMMQGHGDPRWMTYRQAQSVGAQVRKGEKGTPIIYWKFEEERTVHGDDGKPVRDADGNAVKEKVQLERPRSFISYVFNADQIEGLEPLLTSEKPAGWGGCDQSGEAP